MMRLRFTRRFQRAFIRLTDEEAERVRKSLRLLEADLRHPGLRVKKIQGTEGIWEARAGLAIRLTFQTQEDIIILRNVGRHDAVLKR